MGKKEIVAALLAAAWMVQGCSVPKSLGIGSEPEIQAVFRAGEIHATYPGRIDRVSDHAMSALNALGAQGAETQESVPTRRIQGRMANGEPVVITLAPVGPDETMATIRVGAQGDEQGSMTIHRVIVERFRKK